MAEIKIQFRCGDCDFLHDDEDDARECCQPKVHEVYVCLQCEAIHDKSLDAECCCPDEPEDESRMPMASPHELEQAGQLRIF